MPKIPYDKAMLALGVLALVILIVLLIDIALFIAWALRKDAADAGTAPPVFARLWSLVDVWLGGQVAAIVTLGVSALAIAGTVILSGNLQDALDPKAGFPAWEFIGLVAQNAVLAAVPVVYITRKYRIRLREIGLPRAPSRREVITGLKSGIILVASALVLEQAVVLASLVFLGPEKTEALRKFGESAGVERILKGASLTTYVMLFIGAAVLAPIGEEVFFRGFLFNCARRRLGLVGGVILSASIFAAIHISPLVVPVILFMGAYLAIMYYRTGSLWVPIIMHAVNNGTAVSLAFALQHHSK